MLITKYVDRILRLQNRANIYCQQPTLFCESAFAPFDFAPPGFNLEVVEESEKLFVWAIHVKVVN